MRTVSIRLDDQSDALLRAYCALQGVSQTDALREAIRHLPEPGRRSPVELARELDLIGAFDSGRGDLGREHSARVKDKLKQGRHG